MSAQAPLLRSVTVAVPPERAFEVFTRRLGDWWPLREFSVFGERSAGASIDASRVVERSADGEESVWGEVLVFEPPSRLVFTWHPGYGEDEPATEVEVSFRPHGATTVVELQHRGWEALGERAAEARESYASGWTGVLAAYAAAAK
jgi:uncharacterized protein YndB with AHSA1/START domain